MNYILHERIHIFKCNIESLVFVQILVQHNSMRLLLMLYCSTIEQNSVQFSIKFAYNLSCKIHLMLALFVYVHNRKYCSGNKEKCALLVLLLRFRFTSLSLCFICSEVNCFFFLMTPCQGDI